MHTPLPLRATAGLVRVAAAACALSFAVFCALTLLQVVNRYLVGAEIYWIEELVVLLLVWSVMMGLPVALWSRNEIVVDLLELRPGALKQLQTGLAELMSIVFVVALTWSGLQFIDRAGQALSPALELPRWMFYACIPAGSALSALVLIARWWRDAKVGNTPLEDGYVADAHD